MEQLPSRGYIDKPLDVYLFYYITAMFVLILETFTRFAGNVLQMRRDKKRKKRRQVSRKRMETISYDIKQNVDDEQLFIRCWIPCQVEHLDIGYNLPITSSGHISMTNSGSCHQSSYEQSEWEPADIAVLEFKVKKWRKVRK